MRLAAPAAAVPIMAFLRSAGGGPMTKELAVGLFRAVADWYALPQPEPDPQKPAKH